MKYNYINIMNDSLFGLMLRNLFSVYHNIKRLCRFFEKKTNKDFNSWIQHEQNENNYKNNLKPE